MDPEIEEFNKLRDELKALQESTLNKGLFSSFGNNEAMSSEHLQNLLDEVKIAHEACKGAENQQKILNSLQEVTELINNFVENTRNSNECNLTVIPKKEVESFKNLFMEVKTFYNHCFRNENNMKFNEVLPPIENIENNITIYQKYLNMFEIFNTNFQTLNHFYDCIDKDRLK